MSSNYSGELPIDWAHGVQICGGDEAMFRMMLENFEDLSFTKNMEGLFHAIMDMDFKGIDHFAHEIKGPAR